MRIARPFVATSIALLTLAGCKPKQPVVPPPEYRNIATIKDIMDSLVDPNADALWDSVSTVTTKAGVAVNAPKTDADWAEERHRVIAVMEATNLLQMPGRMVAQPGEKAEDSNIEESPEEIKNLIDSDRASWIKYAHGLYDAASVMKTAIDSKNAKGIGDASEGLDEACEHCHENYWYPHQYDHLPKSAPQTSIPVNPMPTPGVPSL
jgi:hypothetical protein